jgi:hypothetical protein
MAELRFSPTRSPPGPNQLGPHATPTLRSSSCRGGRRHLGWADETLAYQLHSSDDKGSLTLTRLMTSFGGLANHRSGNGGTRKWR